MALVLPRLHGASITGGTPTGIHGTNIVDGRCCRAARCCRRRREHDHRDHGPAFVVTIADSGDSQEVGIKVTLTIQKPQGASSRRRRSTLINPGQNKSVTFTDLGQVPFAQKTTVNVDVAAVPGEHNTTNNKASFPVIFSLGWSSAGSAEFDHRPPRNRRTHRGDRRRRPRRVGLGLAWWSWVKVQARPRRAARAARRRPQGSRRLRRLAPGRDRRPAPVGRRGGRPASRASTAASTAPSRTPRSCATTPTRNGRPPVGVARAARLGAHGFVVTAIQGRDYARIYMKELERGRASVALSPEEQEAVERAMGR